MPKEEQKVQEHLLKIAQAHFGNLLSDKILIQAAALVARHRTKSVQAHWRPLPGQAELIDLLRSVFEQAGVAFEKQKSVLDTVAPFVLAKDPAAARNWSESGK
ncbi:MAG: hypothetical protein HQL97_04845 [Magnetococcales bacterium]|nr:hypothetical protein [Magnetococcales bacterium]